MTFERFLSIIRARWLVIVAVFGATVLITLIGSLAFPKRYTAVATVVVDIRPDPVTAMFAGAVPGYMATQVDILTSDRVAQRVVRDLKLASNTALRAQWQDDTDGAGSFEAWVAEQFKRNLDVQPSKDSSVLAVQFKGADPNFAAGLANAFAKAYVATALELRVDSAREFSGFFQAQTNDAREVLERAQARLSQFQREKGLVATDERLDIENTRLAELSSQAVAMQAVSAESKSRQGQAAGGAGDKMAEVLNNPVVASLKADLSRQEARLQEISARLGEKHPQVIELQANIAELRARMEAEVRKVTAGVGVTDTINRQRAGQVAAELDAQRKKVLQLKGVRDESAVLSRDVDAAQRAYDAVVARYNQTNMERQITQSNVRLLSEATPPTTPSSPRIVLNTVLALVVGLFLGVGVALALEALRRHVRSVDDLVGPIGLPVIGVLPKPGARPVRSARRMLSAERLVHRLPAGPRKT